VGVKVEQRGEEIALKALMQTIRARASFDYSTWHFRSEMKTVLLEGTITAPRASFVGLNCYNPPGGIKHCLNTKIAACKLKIS